MTEPRDVPDRHPERLATRPPERPGERPTDEQLRGALDQGQGRDKIAHSDPAAAPLGTDDEAAGTPITAEQAAMARSHEIRGPGQSMSANATDASPATSSDEPHLPPGAAAAKYGDASSGADPRGRDGLGSAVAGSGLPGTGMLGTGTTETAMGHDSTGQPGVGGVPEPTDSTQSHQTHTTPAGGPGHTTNSSNILWIGLAVLVVILLVMWWS